MPTTTARGGGRSSSSAAADVFLRPATQPLRRRKAADTFARDGGRMTELAAPPRQPGDPMLAFARLRIELPDHPGALAAVGRVLAGCGLNVVEVAIHEVEGDRAVDEIVVHGEPLDYRMLAPALAAVGADLLSIAPCEMRGDPVVTALTWVTATLDAPARRSALATGLRMLTGLDHLYVATTEQALRWPIAAAAVRQRQVVVQRLAQPPEPLRTAAPDGDGTGAWGLAVADAAAPPYVAIASRPYSIRFTATEITRLSAVLDCRRRLIAARRHPFERILMR